MVVGLIRVTGYSFVGQSISSKRVFQPIKSIPCDRTPERVLQLVAKKPGGGAATFVAASLPPAKVCHDNVRFKKLKRCSSI